MKKKIKFDMTDAQLKSFADSLKNEGALEEAMESLKLKFTARELTQISLLIWFSPVMQSIRDRIGKLEEQNKTKRDDKK